MRVKTGIDIVVISDFERMMKVTQGSIKRRIFLEEELKGKPNTETLAGMYCAKEAVIKALSLTVDDWKNIKILKYTNGKPYATVKSDFEIESDDLSISHHGDTAVAVYICLIK